MQKNKTNEPRRSRLLLCPPVFCAEYTSYYSWAQTLKTEMQHCMIDRMQAGEQNPFLSLRQPTCILSAKEMDRMPSWSVDEEIALGFDLALPLHKLSVG